MTTPGLSPTRVEWLRVLRTHRLLGTVLVFAVLGLSQPVFLRYAAQIMARVGGGGVSMSFPQPTAPLALSAYLGQAAQLGALLAAWVTIAACSLDATYPLACYYRTRQPSGPRLLAPRLAVSLLTAVAAYVVGWACAGYQTAVLIGGLDATLLARALIGGAAYLTLAVALAAAVATWLRRPLPALGIMAALLLVGLPLLAAIPAAARWAPGALLTAASGWADLAPPLTGTLLAATAFVGLAWYGAHRGRPRR
ncbi:MAG: hypothetical protein M9891_15250 [Austwickia sp.]|nr:hypothetical protein [Actinomycetota bacterium]MCO5310607.1 hypothetical protein [Austwickia sp.]